MTDAEIKVNKPMPGVKGVPFVYVRTVAPANAAALEPFLRDSLTKIGFPRQVNEEELTKLVIQSGLFDGIQNLSNVIALHRLSEIIGPFLVVEVHAAQNHRHIGSASNESTYARVPCIDWSRLRTAL